MSERLAPTVSRVILAANINKLIDAETPKGARRSVRAWAIGKGLDVKLVDRLTKGQHAIGLDKLEELAAACGVKPWHLLLEDFEPGAQIEAPMTDAERAMLKRLRGLLGD
jgi:hypothetical protein